MTGNTCYARAYRPEATSKYALFKDPRPAFPYNYLMRELYPEIEPFKTEHLKASPLHELYVEQSGNPDGQPIVFLHGGPGGGCEAKHRRFFDPKHYRIVLFDQRGCGKSRPSAELEENSTW